MIDELYLHLQIFICTRKTFNESKWSANFKIFK